MKLLVAILVGTAVSDAECSRKKRDVTPAQCRDYCDMDYDYGIIEDTDLCYENCGDEEKVQEHCQK